MDQKRFCITQTNLKCEVPDERQTRKLGVKGRHTFRGHSHVISTGTVSATQDSNVVCVCLKRTLAYLVGK
jgi:hypothetical protein